MKTVPVMTLRDLVLFPGNLVVLFAGRRKTLNAIQASLGKSDPLLLVTQRDVGILDPERADLYDVGVHARVIQMVSGLPDGGSKLLVELLERVRLREFISGDEFPRAVTELLPDAPWPSGADPSGLHELRHYLLLREPSSWNALGRAGGEPTAILNVASVFLGAELPLAERQTWLELTDPAERARRLAEPLRAEVARLRLAPGWQRWIDEREAWLAEERAERPGSFLVVDPGEPPSEDMNATEPRLLQTHPTLDEARAGAERLNQICWIVSGPTGEREGAWPTGS